MQLISQTFGGVVEKADKKEFGKTLCIKDKNSKLISNMKSENNCLDESSRSSCKTSRRI